MDNIVKEIKEFRSDFVGYNKDNIENGISDIEFEEGEGQSQWDDEVWKARGKRPKVTVNTIPAKKARIANRLRPLNPEIKVLPIGEEDKENARVRTGLLKSIQKKSGAESIYDMAFGQMLSTGLSYMRVKPCYSKPDSNDQDLTIEYLPNWTGVYYDWEYKSPIYKDMMVGAVDIKMTSEQYKLKYPNEPESSMPSLNYEFDPSVKSYTTLTEFYRINEKAAKTVSISDGQNVFQGFKDDPRIIQMLEAKTIDGFPLFTVIEERKSFKRQLEWYLVNGSEILDERKDLPGQYIPIIPVEGRTLWVNGQRVIKSYVRDLKSPSRLKNYAKSLEVEMMAYQPLNVWTAPKGGWEEFQEFYKNANNNAFPVLPYNTKDPDTGEMLPPPKREVYQGPSNQLAGVFQSYDKDINDISGDYDEMSNVNQELRSGIAIDLKQRAAGLTNYDYVDSFITRTLTYAGCVLNDLLPYYYTEDRAYEIIGDEGKKERIENFDLAGGEYDVEVHIGASSDTERRESLDVLKEAIATIPGAQDLAYILFKNMDGLKDQDEAVKLLKANLPPEKLQLLESDEAQLSTMLAQAQNQIQMLTQQNEQLNQLVSSMQIDYKKAMDVQTLKSQTDIQKELIKQETTLADQELQNSGDIMQEIVKHMDFMAKKISELEMKVDGNQISVETDKE